MYKMMKWQAIAGKHLIKLILWDSVPFENKVTNVHFSNCKKAEIQKSIITNFKSINNRLKL